MYPIIWSLSARELLFHLVDESDAQGDAIRESVSCMVSELMKQPREAGESRSDNCRIIFFDPLWYFYDFTSDDRMVRIRAIKLQHPRS